MDTVSLLAQIEQLKEKNKTMTHALEKIANWELPESGRFNEKGIPLSYGYCYGSNGERDYMRKVAIVALELSA